MSTQDTEDLQGRVGPFLTYVERVRPDGVVARWDSRRHRKHQPGAPATGSTWWRSPCPSGWPTPCVHCELKGAGRTVPLHRGDDGLRHIRKLVDDLGV